MVSLQRRMSRRHLAQKRSDLDDADDIAVAADSLQDAQGILSRIEEAASKVGLLINASKTKYMHIHRRPNEQQTLRAASGEVPERVQDFKYLGSYTNTADVSDRTGQVWAAANKLRKYGSTTNPAATKHQKPSI